MSRLELTPVHDRITDPQPEIFYEGEAAKYIGMSRPTFRKKLLEPGLIPYSYHIDGQIRIFFRSDLDEYRNNRPRYRRIGKMTMREVSPVASEGVTE